MNSCCSVGNITTIVLYYYLVKIFYFFNKTFITMMNWHNTVNKYSCVYINITAANTGGLYFWMVYHRLICIILSIFDCSWIQNMLSITNPLITDSNELPYFIDCIIVSPTIIVLSAVVVWLKHTTIWPFSHGKYSIEI